MKGKIPYSFHSRLALIAPINSRNPPSPPSIADSMTLASQPSDSRTRIRGNNPKVAAAIPNRNAA